MTDDLVERVALVERMLKAFAHASGLGILPDEDEEFREDLMSGMSAALAIALEEAAQVAESYEPRCDTCPRGVAAAIRAMIKDE